jgi:dTDP-3-amino-3,4,6-trideoxy-alpha-D-glucopyranose N,N-dimethyltransferase
MVEEPFTASARVYDLLYEAAGKNYEVEADDLHALIQSRRPGAASLLDVACGTGAHLLRLRRYYEVAGVDCAPAMLEEARKRLPGVPLIEGDMRSLALERKFDAVTCLFSAIGYMRSCEELDEAIQSMSRHLAPGGVLVVDGWVRRQSWRDPGTVQALSSSRDGVGAARVVVSRREGTSTTLELHHLVGSIDGVEHLVEAHVMTLFSDDEYREAFDRTGLRVDVTVSPHPDRDRYIGTLPG